MTISRATHQLLILYSVEGNSPSWVRDVLFSTRNSSYPFAFDAVREALEKIEGSRRTVAELDAEKQIELTEKVGGRILSPLDMEYPTLLLESPEYPPLLWVRGTLTGQSDRSVAIIGPREPTRHGLIIAERISRYFIEQKWSIVSGLAVGCDTAAHVASLDAGGHTVAVLAHGLQTLSPAQNKDLATRIVAEGGALVTEFATGISPKPHQFVQRDRTQAGLSRGVIMVQSDLKGGSLHAPRAALSYGRWIGVPAPTTADLSIKASKIEANQILIHGTVEEKLQLMRCQAEALKRLIVLEGKDDYAQLLSRSPAVLSADPVQSTFL